MKLSALLLVAYFVPAVAQSPAPEAVVIPAEAFAEIRTEFAKMRAYIEAQQKRINELRQRYECT